MDYAAPYRGNFISAIETIENNYKNGNIIYLFPEGASKFSWCKEMIKIGKRIYFIHPSFYSRKVKYFNINALLTIIRKEEIKVVHTHFMEYNYTLFLLKMIFFRNLYFIANFHNHYLPGGKLKYFKNWIVKMTLDFYIGDSKSVSQSLYQQGVKKSKVVTINNSINFNRLKEYNNLSITSATSNQSALMFGYPWFRKGVDVVAKALFQINQHRTTKITLAIAQAGGVEETKKAIYNLFDCMPEWVNFIPPREDLASYYNAASIFISAGREEGLSYSPLEAAYCDCLLICSNINGNPLDIPNMPIYDVEDPVTLSGHIQLLLSMEQAKKEKVLEAQRNYVVKNYNINSWVEQIIKCY